MNEKIEWLQVIKPQWPELKAVSYQWFGFFFSGKRLVVILHTRKWTHQLLDLWARLHAIRNPQSPVRDSTSHCHPCNILTRKTLSNTLWLSFNKKLWLFHKQGSRCLPCSNPEIRNPQKVRRDKFRKLPCANTTALLQNHPFLMTNLSSAVAYIRNSKNHSIIKVGKDLQGYWVQLLTSHNYLN